ncbi:hypothetical protein C5O80_20525 [Burkholderia sp. SRS-46]|nr:hypothetical protein C5O80_20525 [Burkholderia sp. SRS-46]
MSIRIPPADRSWTIRRTLCFDSAGHAFRRRDVEITGARISAVLPPGTSTLADGIDGTALVCTPGVVGVEPRRGGPVAAADLPACVTTLGHHCANLLDLPARAAASAARVVALLHFDDKYLEQINGFLDWAASPLRRDLAAHAERRVTVLPVLSSGNLLSASEIVEFARFAKLMGTRFGVRLASNADESQAFRSRFYCSESALTAYLLPQEKQLTLFGAARTDRRDVASLARIHGAVSIELTDASSPAALWRSHAPLLRQRRAALHVRADLAAAVLARVAAHAPPDRVDFYVDALTRSAAASLGLADVGVLAPGMKADLCAFDADRGDDYDAGSTTLLSLLATRRPAFTLVGGRAVREREPAPEATPDTRELAAAGG